MAFFKSDALDVEETDNITFAMNLAMIQPARIILF
jgi:hypothetical protein